MADKLKEFFEQHQHHEHYADVQQRPDHVWDWQTNAQHRREYADWIMTESNVASLKMQVDIPDRVNMAEEAMEVIDQVVKHRGDEHPGWYSVTLHGVDKHTTDDWTAPQYADRGWTEMPEYDWTDVADDCPTIKNWLIDNWHFREYHRVRLMLLVPGGKILPHQDYEHRKLAAYNFALTNPPGNEFCMEDAGLIPWQSGECRAIDIGRQHSVRNIGEQRRIHMIIHGIPAPEHLNVMCASYDELLRECGMME